jgi:hypothetical protein
VDSISSHHAWFKMDAVGTVALMAVPTHMDQIERASLFPDTSDNTNGVYKTNTTQTTNES